MQFWVNNFNTLDHSGEWPATQRGALGASIQKWRAIARWYKHNPDNPAIYNIGEPSCALCHLYIAKDCRDCPVALKTGAPFCRRTPFEAFERGQGSVEHAQAELAFLRSLREDLHA